MTKNQFILPGIIAVIALFIGLSASLLVNRQIDKPEGITSIGGDFTLQSSKGPVTLSEDLGGKVVALYFGFASCPDVCPTSLNILAAALRQLSDEERRQVQPVFVSVDPERDDVEKLNFYVNAFYPGMLGLTADPEVIKDVAWQYRAIYKKVPLEDSAMGYTIDHSSIIYVIGRNGVIQSLAQHGAVPAEVAAKIKAALSNT